MHWVNAQLTHTHTHRENEEELKAGESEKGHEVAQSGKNVIITYSDFYPSN